MPENNAIDKDIKELYGNNVPKAMGALKSIRSRNASHLIPELKKLSSDHRKPQVILTEISKTIKYLNDNAGVKSEPQNDNIVDTSKPDVKTSIDQKKNLSTHQRDDNQIVYDASDDENVKKKKSKKRNYRTKKLSPNVRGSFLPDFGMIFSSLLKSSSILIILVIFLIFGAGMILYFFPGINLLAKGLSSEWFMTYPEAVSSYQQFLEIAQERTDIYGPETVKNVLWRIINIHLETGNQAEAVNLLRKLLELDPNNTNTWLQMARSLDKTGDLAGASEAYKKALEYCPEEAAKLRDMIVGEKGQLDLKLMLDGKL